MRYGFMANNGPIDKLAESKVQDNYIDEPSHLRGLEQAAYILKELCKGKEKSVLIREMNGDRQLVDMWTNFIRHNHWIAYNQRTKEWELTDKGTRWIKQINSILPPLPSSSSPP